MGVLAAPPLLSRLRKDDRQDPFLIMKMQTTATKYLVPVVLSAPVRRGRFR